MAVFLKAKGLDVLRALLRAFYCHLTGECFPSYDAIAEAAGCARSTVAAKLRILEQLGFIETIRRKVVASFTSRAYRVRFDVAVQTSNSYRFSLPGGDQPAQICAPSQAKPRPSAAKEAESKFLAVTSSVIQERGDGDLAADKARWICALLGTGKAG
jgi:DNA-binding transcriptional MocR family regulator